MLCIKANFEVKSYGFLVVILLWNQIFRCTRWIFAAKSLTCKTFYEQYLQYYVNYVKFSSSALEIDVIMTTLYMQFMVILNLNLVS